MSSLIQPSNFRAMSTWCDAYTLYLEAIAEARNSRAMQAGLNDSLKHAKSEAKRTGSAQDIMTLENQAAINRHLAGSSPEEHRELMAVWKQARTELLGTGWDLTEEVHICLDRDNKSWCYVWQGDEPTPSKKALRLRSSLGAMVRRFLLFVAENSTKFDPVAYTKQVLERQGINEHNFHLHADKLAIVNPWKPVV